MNFKVLSIVIGISLLAACTPASSNAESTVKKNELDPNACYFPDTTKVAPDWVCGAPVDGYALSAVGVAPVTKAGTDVALKQANEDAREVLESEMVESFVFVLEHVEISNGDEETKATIANRISRELKKNTAEIFANANPLEYIQGPDGLIYTLLVLDQTQVESAVKRTLVKVLGNISGTK